MGTGMSRSKKVAPACVEEVTGTTSAASSNQDNSLFKPIKINAVLRNARKNGAQPDSHSEGHDSDFSEDDDDVDGKPRCTVLADYQVGEKISGKKLPLKRSFLRSRTYGLCYFGEDDAEDDLCSVTADGNRSRSAFTHSPKRTAERTSHHNSSSPRAFLTGGALLEAVLTSDKQSTFDSCPVSSLTMPVILYDGSEEELMDTIEREFS